MAQLVGKIGEREIWRFPSFARFFFFYFFSLSLLFHFFLPPLQLLLIDDRIQTASRGTGNCVQAETPRLCRSEWPPSIPPPQRRKPKQGARFAFVIKYLPEVNWVSRARVLLLFQFLGLNESGPASVAALSYASRRCGLKQLKFFEQMRRDIITLRY